MRDSSFHERILISVALFLSAGILCYNFFFIPDLRPATVVYIDKPEENTYEEAEEDEIAEENNDKNTKLNINTASLQELTDVLPHVGKVLAQRIIDYRKEHGTFKSIEELKNVKGIGAKLFDNIRSLICL